MGLYLRKSKSFGPLRLNFSKSGIGVSAGVKGLRVGTRAGKGAYLYGGRNGIYYRKTLSSGSKAARPAPTPAKRAPRADPVTSVHAPAATADTTTTAALTTVPPTAASRIEVPTTTAPPTSPSRTEVPPPRGKGHQIEGASHSSLAHKEALSPAPTPTAGGVRFRSALGEGLERASGRLRIEHTDSVSRSLSLHVPVLTGVKLALVALLLVANVVGLSSDRASASHYVGPITLWVGIAAFIVWHRWDATRHLPVTLTYGLSSEAALAFEELSSAVTAMEAPESAYGVLAEDGAGAGQPTEGSMPSSHITRLPIHVSRGATIDHLVTDVAYPSISLADRIVVFLPDRALFSMKLSLRRRWGFMSIPYAQLAVAARVLHVTGDNQPLTGSESSTLPDGTTSTAYGDLSFASARHGLHEILRLHTATPAMAQRIATAIAVLGDAVPPAPH